MTVRRALINGITGQDGSYLAELLLEEGYEVWGLVRGSSQEGHARIAGILDRVRLLRGDLLDQSSLQRALARARSQWRRCRVAPSPSRTGVSLAR